MTSQVMNVDTAMFFYVCECVQPATAGMVVLACPLLSSPPSMPPIPPPPPYPTKTNLYIHSVLLAMMSLFI